MYIILPSGNKKALRIALRWTSLVPPDIKKPLRIMPTYGMLKGIPNITKKSKPAPNARRIESPMPREGFCGQKKSPRFPGGMVAKMLRFYSSVNTLLA